jgi:hypothetical protein
MTYHLPAIHKNMKENITELIMRRHPRYEELLPHWNFLEETYEGGRAWFKNNIFRYLKEGDVEYADRVKRAYRFNHTKQVVDLVDKYLFKMNVARRVEDAPPAVTAFWKNATLSGLDMDAFARRISNATSRYGRVWVVVDSTFKAPEGEVITTIGDKAAAGGRPYAYIVRPQDMLDMSYDETGELNWALVREIGRDDDDPFSSSGQAQLRYRLWTRDGWFLFQETVVAARARYKSDASSGSGTSGRLKQKVVLVSADNHDLGVVPIVQADHQFSEEPYEFSGLIDDVAYLDRANANYLSNLDAVIQDQTFSQLTMPAQGLMPGDDQLQKLVEMGSNRIFTYNGEAGQKPEYISPDPRQASMILAAVGKIINEIYHSVGLSAERTKDDNGGGVDNSSGVAKAYDFERVNSLLASKAQSLQVVELRIARLVAMWEGQVDGLNPESPLITYPDKFDTRSLYDEFEIAARLSLLAAPDEVRRLQMKQVVDKMFPGASEEQRKKLEKALDEWPPEPVDIAAATAPGLGAKDKAKKSKAGGSDPLKAASTQKTAKELAA